MDRSTDPQLFNLLTESFARIVGWPLLAARRGPNWLYRNAPFAVLAHNADPDPRFIYANRTAQRLFGYGWEEFTALPSRRSVRSFDAPARARLLDRVIRDGFVTGCGGIRVDKSGRAFRIEQAIVWELIDDAGKRHGQGAAFADWSEVDR